MGLKRIYTERLISIPKIQMEICSNIFSHFQYMDEYKSSYLIGRTIKGFIELHKNSEDFSGSRLNTFGMKKLIEKYGAEGVPEEYQAAIAEDIREYLNVFLGLYKEVTQLNTNKYVNQEIQNIAPEVAETILKTPKYFSRYVRVPPESQESPP
ncbi:MAG: hypothetical protein GF364_01735 [Candidatus Lokiarchaeota archaeon]|nr:hypothetical protein [Candidatus Lokiarchaeota archaeon]